MLVFIRFCWLDVLLAVRRIYLGEVATLQSSGHDATAAALASKT